MSRRIFFLIAMVMFSSAAFGQMEGNPPNWCRGGFFASESENFSIGTVTGKRGTRSYFFSDDREDCPAGKNCRARSYVIAGDEVIVNRTFNGFACSWFPGKNGGTVGWLRVASLDMPESLYDASPAAWSGEWEYAENSIKLEPEPNSNWLRVTGNAFWKGLGDNIHIGELDGRAEAKNGILKYSDGDDEYDCKVTMRLLGSYLIVSDNLKCGGVNVSFSGVYRRNSKQR